MILIATGLLFLGGLVLAAAAIAACILSSRISRRTEESKNPSAAAQSIRPNVSANKPTRAVDVS